MPDTMTPEQLTTWIAHMGISVSKACEMLGISRQTAYTWLRGEAPIPKAAELACAALTLGVRSYPLPERLNAPGADSGPPGAASEPELDPGVEFVLAAPFSGPPGLPRD